MRLTPLGWGVDINADVEERTVRADEAMPGEEKAAIHHSRSCATGRGTKCLLNSSTWDGMMNQENIDRRAHHRFSAQMEFGRV